MRIFPGYVLFILVPILPAQGQVLPFYPVPGSFIPVTPPGKTQLVPQNPSSAPCPPGTSPNARVGGRCLPNQKGRAGIENLEESSTNTPAATETAPTSEMPTTVTPEANPSEASPVVAPAPGTTGTASTPNPQATILKQTIAEATEDCAKYPGSVPSPLTGGYACIPEK